MNRLDVSIEIAAPPDVVWAVMRDVERWHEWTASITSVRRLDSGPFAVGSRAVIKQPRFPPATWVVTSLVPGRSFVWESLAPGLKVSGHHTVEPAAAGSRATLAVEFEGFLGGVWRRLTRGITMRYITLEAHGLKARSEQPTPTRSN